MIPEPLDRRLRDDAAMDEIELTSRLIIAGSSSDQRLSPIELDAILFSAEPEAI